MDFCNSKYFLSMGDHYCGRSVLLFVMMMWETAQVEALKIKNIEPYIVSESAGTQDIDAKAMKTYYFSL